MTLRRCLACSTFFAVGIDKCPHCGSAEHVEAGAQKPKAKPKPKPKARAKGGK